LCHNRLGQVIKAGKTKKKKEKKKLKRGKKKKKKKKKKEEARSAKFFSNFTPDFLEQGL
jgi:hypothetical protein